MEETLAFPPWLDLPEPLAELVLERLPLVDYIHFAAICPKWRLIQRGHRLRHAPHPPPMAKQLPWLAPFRLYPHGELKVYSPLDRKFYTLPNPSIQKVTSCLASCHGWLLLLEDNHGPTPTSKQAFLFNPITATQILLPSLSLMPYSHAIGTMSAPPTDPNCIVLLVFGSCAFLYRLNDHCAADWTIVQLTPFRELFGGSAIYCGGKFYYSESWEDKLYVINPFLQKAASQLVMRYPYIATTNANFVSLFEVSGELFSVLTCNFDTLWWYRVFKADLSKQEWVTVDTIGNHALFHHITFLVLLLAADVDFKRDSIYTFMEVQCDGMLGHDLFTWGVFELDAGCWTKEETLLNINFGPWFLSTLDSVNLVKASD